VDVAELLRIVEAERLDSPVLHDAGRHHAHAVVLRHEDGAWHVALTDERAQPYERTARTFADEGEALEYVLVKLRQTERARRAVAEYPG
jgi:hypothetical protein